MSSGRYMGPPPMPAALASRAQRHVRMRAATVLGVNSNLSCTPVLALLPNPRHCMDLRSEYDLQLARVVSHVMQAICQIDKGESAHQTHLIDSFASSGSALAPLAVNSRAITRMKHIEVCKPRGTFPPARRADGPETLNISIQTALRSIRGCERMSAPVVSASAKPSDDITVYISSSLEWLLRTLGRAENSPSISYLDFRFYLLFALKLDMPEISER
jgi:hypothetical protein